MRWLVRVLFAAAAVGAAVFAAGLYLLPPTAVVTRSAMVGRPASIVYPLLINLRTFTEFSPWAERDPKADFYFDGPSEGAGQTVRWVSSVAALGRGQMTITKTTENRDVEMRIDAAARPIPYATPRSESFAFVLEPDSEGNTKVAWSLTMSCAAAPIAVPCRLASFVSTWRAARELEIGLDKLQGVAEQLPALDIADIAPERLVIAPRQFAYVQSDLPQGAEAFRAALRRALSSVDAFMKKNALAPAAPPLAVNVADDAGNLSLRAGRAFDGALASASVPGDVAIGETPAGPVLKILFIGPYANMNPTYAKLDAYVRAHRLAPAGDPWEVYIDDPDRTPNAKLRTEIYYPIKTN